MSKVVEKTAKTIEDAIALALKELNLDREDTQVEVLEEGRSGIFGIGAKDAHVRVTACVNLEKRAREFLNDVFTTMGMDVQLDIRTEGKVMNINLIGENMGLIIGKRGDTLDALEHLVNLCVNKGDGEYTKVVLDTENYRSKREQTLVKLAKNLAEYVVKNNRKRTLEPMHSNERRIIHATLQNDPNVDTYSVGDEPNRKVVVAPKR